ncbi:uncharacterized protein LOC112639533 [Camponotus floridanus]|uniref:uncharacterized protein LOC112639533 n=1 Tax=Camponotus floridanus TaxID=104421 RepID=UPI000DC666CA|nr:uncharacterized protein LOC112639533 [Camponotus floridanus]
MDGKVFSRNYCIKFAYQPKRRTPLTSYMQRLSLQYVYPDNTVFNKQILTKIYFVPVLHISSIYKHQSSIKPTTFGKAELNKNSPNQSSKMKQEKKNFFYLIFLIVNILAIIIICSIIIRVILDVMDKNTMQPISNHTSVIFKLVKNIKAADYNHESDIWNNISSSINKIISRATRKPLIILLFSNETTTMDSLAVALAYASSNALNTNSSLCLNPENFRDDTGEIIDI